MAKKFRGTVTRKKKSGRISGAIPKGAEVGFMGKTKSGKGTVKLYAKKGFAGIKETRTSYRTSAKYGSKRRVLQVITIRKVIK